MAINKVKYPGRSVVRILGDRRWLYFAVLAAMVCASCRREQVTVYRVPKGSEEPQMMSGGGAQSGNGNAALPPGHPGADAQAQEQSRLKYEVPAGWTEETPTGMSVALLSLAHNTAALSVMTFPKQGIQALSLINIVREEDHLPALNDAELAKLSEEVTIGPEKGQLIDLTAGTSTNAAAPESRTLVAVVPHDGVTWFFKFSGTTKAVTDEKPTLINFLKTVSFVTGGPAQPTQVASANSAPFASGSAPALTGSDSGDNPNKPQWEVPSTWKEVPPTQMLLAKFIAGGADAEADITVSFFGGDAGGIMQNINRWRNQVGVAPVDASGLKDAGTSLEIGDDHTTLVDVTGTSPKTGKETRIIGVIWPRKGETWFYKMMGDPATAGREKDALVKFVKSVRYPNA